MKHSALLVLGLSTALGCASAPPGARAHSPLRLEQAELTPVSLGYRFGGARSDWGHEESVSTPASLFGRYRLDEDWSVGLGIDFMEGEIEEPARELGLVRVPGEESEGIVSMTQIGVWVERALWREGGHSFFGLAGLGAALIDMEDVEGSLQGGGEFEVEVDGEIESVLTVGCGYRWRFGERWGLEVTGRYERHSGGWEIVDEVSGASEGVEDYGLVTFLVGISYHF